MAHSSALINVMVAAAQKASRKLLRDFGEVENLQVSRKGPADFVNSADKTAEDTLRYELTKARPKYSFLMEESGEVVGSDTSNIWIIDPLDGHDGFRGGGICFLQNFRIQHIPIKDNRVFKFPGNFLGSRKVVFYNLGVNPGVFLFQLLRQKQTDVSSAKYQQTAGFGLFVTKGGHGAGKMFRVDNKKDLIAREHLIVPCWDNRLIFPHQSNDNDVQVWK